MDNLVYAMASGQPAASGSSTFLSFMPIILIFMIIYFLMIRPQQKKQREHQTMLGALKKGDRVMTTSGIYGTVVGLKDESSSSRSPITSRSSSPSRPSAGRSPRRRARTTSRRE